MKNSFNNFKLADVKSQKSSDANRCILTAVNSPASIHSDSATINLVYLPNKLNYTQPIIMEVESAEICAYIFKLNNLSIRFRVAKNYAN